MSTSICFINLFRPLEFTNKAFKFGQPWKRATCLKTFLLPRSLQVNALVPMDEQGRVAVPTPFGIVFRRPMQLPEQVAVLSSMKENEDKYLNYFTEEKFEQLVSRIRSKGRGTAVSLQKKNLPLSPSDLKRRAEKEASSSSKRKIGQQIEQGIDYSDYKVMKGETAESAPSVRDKLAALQELRFFPAALAVPFLLECVRADGPCETDELVRSQALYSLALFATQLSYEKSCLDTILYVLNNDPEPSIRASAASALGFMRKNEAVPSLMYCLQEDNDWIVRMTCINSLGALKDARAVPLLMSVLKAFPVDRETVDSFILQSIIGALGELGAMEALPLLVLFKGHPEEMVRFQLAETLRFFSISQQAIQVLETLTQDAAIRVAEQAKATLVYLQQTFE
eukprot:jgi/Galph1/5506/GphlegSOOS_G4173.1